MRLKKSSIFLVVVVFILNLQFQSIVAVTGDNEVDELPEMLYLTDAQFATRVAEANKELYEDYGQFGMVEHYYNASQLTKETYEKYRVFVRGSESLDDVNQGIPRFAGFTLENERLFNLFYPYDENNGNDCWEDKNWLTNPYWDNRVLNHKFFTTIQETIFDNIKIKEKFLPEFEEAMRIQHGARLRGEEKKVLEYQYNVQLLLL